MLAAADGEKLVAWHVPPQGDRPVVVLFHGAGDVLARRAARFQRAHCGRNRLGGALLPRIRRLERAPDRALACCSMPPPPMSSPPPATRRSASCIWGISLGTGPAVAIAAARPIGKLVLEAPYTSTVEVAASFMPIVPVRMLMKDQFRSDERIGKVTAPLLVLHGERDRTVAVRFGERLFALAREPKRLVRFPNGRHNDLDAHGAVEEAQRFIYE